jgi:hypothetical protein
MASFQFATVTLNFEKAIVLMNRRTNCLARRLHGVHFGATQIVVDP